MQEIWKHLKNIVEYGDNYAISNTGKIKNITNGRILKPYVKKNGYLQIDLFLNKKRKKYYLHRIVALAFIPNPESKPEVNHSDGDKNNNNVSNLEWHTRLENVNHSITTGLKNQNGSKNSSSLLTEDMVVEIRKLYGEKRYKQIELAKMFNVSKQTISLVVNRKSWKHVD